MTFYESIANQCTQTLAVWMFIATSGAVSIKHGLRTAEHGLRTGYKIRTRYEMRTPD